MAKAKKKPPQKDQFEKVREKYKPFKDAEFVDKDGVVKCTGSICQIRRFNHMIIFVVRDDEGPMAWAMVYKDVGKVIHLGEELTIRILDDGVGNKV